MDKIYKEIPARDILWNMEEPPEIPRSLVRTKALTPCKVIELGCGAGNYRGTSLGTVLYFSTEEEIGALFGKRFVVEELKTGEIEGKDAPHKAVFAMMKRR